MKARKKQNRRPKKGEKAPRKNPPGSGSGAPPPDPPAGEMVVQGFQIMQFVGPGPVYGLFSISACISISVISMVGTFTLYILHGALQTVSDAAAHVSVFMDDIVFSVERTILRVIGGGLFTFEWTAYTTYSIAAIFFLCWFVMMLRSGFNPEANLSDFLRWTRRAVSLAAEAAQMEALFTESLATVTKVRTPAQ